MLKSDKLELDTAATVYSVLVVEALHQIMLGLMERATAQVVGVLLLAVLRQKLLELVVLVLLAL